MARTSNLTDFLTDVSSAIKQKTGDSAPIPASEFDTEILSIETGGNYQSKTLNITQNGNYNLLPDQEFDAISNVNISVSVSPVLQNKTITENGSYTADQNYDGLGTVIVNVPSTGIDTSDATATASEIIAPKTAYVNGEKITGTIIPTYEKTDKNYKTITVSNAIDNSSKCSGSNNDGYIVVCNGSSIQLMKDGELITTFTSVLPSTTHRFVTLGNCYFADDKREMLLMYGYGGDNHQSIFSFAYYKLTFDGVNWTISSITTSFNLTSSDYWSNNGWGLYGKLTSNSNGHYLVCIGGGNASQIRAFAINYTPFTDATTFDLTVCGLFYTYGSGGGNVQSRELIQLDVYTLSDDRFVINWIDKTYKTMIITDSTLSAITYHNNYSSSYTGSYTNSKYLISENTYIQTTYSSNVVTIKKYNTSGSVLATTTINTSATQLLPSVTNDGDFLLQVYHNNTVKVYVISSDDLSILNTYSYGYVGLNRSSVRIASDCKKCRYIATNVSIVEIQNVSDEVLMAMKKDDITYLNTTTATATSADILMKQTAYGPTGKIEGTMPNNGAQVYVPGDSVLAISDGYHKGSTISAVDITTLNDYAICEAIADNILGDTKPYVELEYVQSTGSQFIDTGYVPNDNTKYEITLSDIVGSREYVIFGTGAYNSSQHLLVAQFNNIRWYYPRGNFVNITTDTTTKCTITLYRGTTTYNGTTVSSSTTTNGATNTTNLYICKCTGSSAYASYKLYRFKVYENNVLVRDFIPVKDLAGKACLYDLVENKFYYSTTDFIAGGVI